MSRSRKMGLSAPKQITFIVAVALWVLGAASVLFDLVALPGNLGIWALAIGGLLLILGVLVDGL